MENTIDEFTIHLLGRKTHIRFHKPREVVQEVYRGIGQPVEAPNFHVNNLASDLN